MLDSETTTPTSVAVVAYYATAALATTLILVASYRLFAHPLKDYPGPVAAKLTQFYAGRYVLLKRLHLEILQLHAKYGPVIRLGPNTLVFNTATALRDIYQNDRIRKSPNYHTTIKNNVYSIFHAIDPEIHRQRRRMIGQVISERAMRSFEPVMSHEIDIFLEHIKEASQSSTPVNMTPTSRYLSLDISGQLTYGYGLEMQTSEKNRFMISAIQAGNFMGSVFLHLPFFSKIKYLDPIINRIFHETRGRFLRLLDTIYETRAALDKHTKPDFYSYVADEIGAKEIAASRESVFWQEALFLLTAGGDTVATLIPTTFFYLSRNPSIYRQLAHEIRTTFTHSSEIRAGPKLSSCVYLRACIDESLRMSPPVPTTLWRVQDPQDPQPLYIDGHFVPRGTSIGVNTYAIHHNAEYFPNPSEYRPERWLAASEGGDDAERKRALEAFTAFGVGPRSCAGKPMAYLEASLVLAKVLWFFDFEAAEGELGKVGEGREGAGYGRERVGEFQLGDMFIATHDGPWLVFRGRGGVE